MKEDMRCASPRLVVMLTYNDFTIEDAEAVFSASKDSKALYWGFKEKPLPEAQMRALYAEMKECGKTTVLEVVGYDEAAGLQGARLAVDCGVDILMGTKFHNSVAQLCHENNIKYMPFVGSIEGRPSVLRGSIDEIVAEAKDVVARGADGVDLLGYRYEGDPCELNRRLVSEVDAPVCIAGSIDSFSRLDEVKDTGAWGFTIGSAFFDDKFVCQPGDDMSRQIDRVVEYLG